MKRKVVVKLGLLFLTAFLMAAGNASAQSLAYRQTNLTSDVPGLADHMDPFLEDPWGIAVVPNQSFFAANAGQNYRGTVTVAVNAQSVLIVHTTTLTVTVR